MSTDDHTGGATFRSLLDLSTAHLPELLGTDGLSGQDGVVAYHVIGNVVPQPEQHRHHRRGQGQHARPADRRVLSRADGLPDPADKVGELLGR
jgi:hypothetical protein